MGPNSILYSIAPVPSILLFDKCRCNFECFVQVIMIFQAMYEISKYVLHYHGNLMRNCNDVFFFSSENRNPYQKLQILLKANDCYNHNCKYSCKLHWKFFMVGTILNQLFTYQFCNNDLIYPTDFPPLVLEG